MLVLRKGEKLGLYVFHFYSSESGFASVYGSYKNISENFIYMIHTLISASFFPIKFPFEI